MPDSSEFYKNRYLYMTYRCRACNHEFTVSPIKLKMDEYSALEYAHNYFRKTEHQLVTHRCNRKEEGWGIAELIKVFIRDELLIHIAYYVPESYNV